MDEDTAKFYDLVDRIEKLCRERGELSLAEVERMAKESNIRASAILEDLSLAEGFTVDLAGGKVLCPSKST